MWDTFDRFEKTTILFCAVCLALAALVALAFGQCGGKDRWKIKTAQDIHVTKAEGIAAKPEEVTVSELVDLPRPGGSWLTLPRTQNEARIVSVIGTIVQCGEESDSDFHIVLRDGDQSLICEIPCPECTPGSPFAAKWEHARQLLRVWCGPITHRVRIVTHVRVRITGFIFFDKIAHGDGHSANGIEIHPVFNIELISQ
jgi:hypothetical protein